jgi:hypothetical protein
MSAIRLAIAPLLLAAFARATCAQDATAWIRCDVAAHELVVFYEPGEAGKPYGGPADHVVQLYDLLEVDAASDRVTDTREAHFECRLGNDLLDVALSPVPGNANLQGSCGGELGGMLDVSRDGVAVVDDFEFEPGECHSREAYTWKFVLEAGARDYRVERRAYDDGE